jgi:ArsR family transcriptional regulator
MYMARSTKGQSMSKRVAAGPAGVFKALADDTRLRIIKILEAGELCACDIVAALGVPQPRASFHLGVLKRAGLVRHWREGRWGHYALEGSDAFRRFLLLSVLERLPDVTARSDIKRLKIFLKEKKKC